MYIVSEYGAISECNFVGWKASELAATLNPGHFMLSKLLRSLPKQELIHFTTKKRWFRTWVFFDVFNHQNHPKTQISHKSTTRKKKRKDLLIWKEEKRKWKKHSKIISISIWNRHSFENLRLSLPARFEASAHWRLCQWLRPKIGRTWKTPETPCLERRKIPLRNRIVCFFDQEPPNVKRTSWWYVVNQPGHWTLSPAALARRSFMYRLTYQGCGPMLRWPSKDPKNRSKKLVKRTTFRVVNRLSIPKKALTSLT